MPSEERQENIYMLLGPEPVGEAFLSMTQNLETLNERLRRFYFLKTKPKISVKQTKLLR